MEPVYHWYLESVFRENILIAHIHLIFNKWVHLPYFLPFFQGRQFWDFMFASLDDKTLPRRAILSKVPWNVYSFTLIHHGICSLDTDIIGTPPVSSAPMSLAVQLTYHFLRSRYLKSFNILHIKTAQAWIRKKQIY